MKNKIGFAAVTAFNFGALIYCLNAHDVDSFWTGFALGISFTVLGSILLED